MEFQVPQFIEREIRIAGPLTFRQFLLLAGAGIVVFFLYFVLASKSFLLFSFLAAIAGIISLALAFGEVKGLKFTTVISNFLTYSFSAKTYFWQKKAASPKLIEISKPFVQAEAPAAETKRKSKLENLSTQLETGMH